MTKVLTSVVNLPAGEVQADRRDLRPLPERQQIRMTGLRSNVRVLLAGYRTPVPFLHSTHRALI